MTVCTPDPEGCGDPLKPSTGTRMRGVIAIYTNPILAGGRSMCVGVNANVGLAPW